MIFEPLSFAAIEKFLLIVLACALYFNFPYIISDAMVQCILEIAIFPMHTETMIQFKLVP
jgi:hypothetical protein